MSEKEETALAMRPSGRNPRTDLVGRRFGRLVVIAYGGVRPTRNKHQWICVCDCGGQKTVVGEDLNNRSTQSCGCFDGGRIYPIMHTFLQSHFGQSGCWEYPKGNGHYGRSGNHAAHRLAYEIATGIKPGALKVCHSCDNPPCCNPAHLFLGTQLDNVKDCIAKDRHSRGERSGASKLTAEQVLAIRSDKRSLKAIAADYGIHLQYVSELRRRRAWRHL